MSKSINELKSEFKQIENELSDPQIHSDQLKYKQLSKKYTLLKELIDILSEYENLKNDLMVAIELSKQDDTFEN